jgi:hypothetical protein
MLSSNSKVNNTETNRDKDKLGLCAHCKFAQHIASSKGSTFLLCGLSKTDPRFPKYPRLPVVTCSGYQKSSAGTEQQ